jgi:hypothetical protein
MEKEFRIPLPGGTLGWRFLIKEVERDPEPRWRGSGDDRSYNANSVSIPEAAMRITMQHVLFWTPRALCLLFAVFLSLFALDVFGEGRGPWGTLVALFMHLIPTWIVLIVLAISWHREWAGAILFAALGVRYLVMAWGRFHWSAYVVISGPLFLVGTLFLIDWLYQARLGAN